MDLFVRCHDALVLELHVEVLGARGRGVAGAAPAGADVHHHDHAVEVVEGQRFAVLIDRRPVLDDVADGPAVAGAPVGLGLGGALGPPLRHGPAEGAVGAGLHLGQVVEAVHVGVGAVGVEAQLRLFVVGQAVAVGVRWRRVGGGVITPALAFLVAAGGQGHQAHREKAQGGQASGHQSTSSMAALMASSLAPL